MKPLRVFFAFLVFSLFARSVSGQVGIQFESKGASDQLSFELLDTPSGISVSGPVVRSREDIDFSSGSNGDGFGVTMTGVTDWDSTKAVNALAQRGFPEYVEGLTSAPLWVSQQRVGVNSAGVRPEGDAKRGRLNLYGEAIILKFDTTGIGEGRGLVLNSIKIKDFVRGKYKGDAVFYDASEGVPVSTSFQSTNEKDLLSFLPSTIDSGDFLVLANAFKANGRGWALMDFEFDIVWIPEPRNLSLVIGALLLSIIYIRRRERV